MKYIQTHQGKEINECYSHQWWLGFIWCSLSDYLLYSKQLNEEKCFWIKNCRCVNGLGHLFVIIQLKSKLKFKGVKQAAPGERRAHCTGVFAQRICLTPGFPCESECVRLCVLACVCLHMCVCACMCVCVCVCVLACVYVCVCIWGVCNS